MREAQAENALAPSFPARIDAEEREVSRGLAGLLIAILYLVRQVIERQVLHRVEGGSLTDEEIERLGRALAALDRRMSELRRSLTLDAEQESSDRTALELLLENPSTPSQGRSSR